MRSKFSSINCRYRKKTRARSTGGVSRHAGNASAAASTARSTCSFVHAGTSAMTSPRDGLKTGVFSTPEISRHSPLTNAGTEVMTQNSKIQNPNSKEAPDSKLQWIIFGKSLRKSDGALLPRDTGRVLHQQASVQKRQLDAENTGFLLPLLRTGRLRCGSPFWKHARSPRSNWHRCWFRSRLIGQSSDYLWDHAEFSLRIARWLHRIWWSAPRDPTAVQAGRSVTAFH